MEQTERDSLVELLKTHTIEIKFTKTDGTKATMQATLQAAVLPPITESTEKPKKERKANPDVLSFYSIDRFGWRSVRYDLIESYKVITCQQ